MTNAMRFILISIMLLKVIQLNAMHPVHVSVVNLEYLPDSAKIIYSVRVFPEDFEGLINAYFGVQLNTMHQNDLTKGQVRVINKYFSETFIICADSQLVETQLTGWEISDMSLWFYYQAEIPEIINSFTLKNKIMLEAFADQNNLLIFVMEDRQEGITFDKQRTEYQFTIQNIKQD